MGRKVTLKKKAAIFRDYRTMRICEPSLSRGAIIDELQKKHALKWDTVDRIVTTGEELYRISSDG